MSGVLIVAAAAFLVLVDPYGAVGFSLPIDRYVPEKPRSFTMARLVRDPDADSAVIGTSTIMLLDPKELDIALGGRFVNLTLLAGKSWEQRTMVETFVRHHRDVRTIIIGIDQFWCDTKTRSGGDQPMPAWAYNDVPFDDLGMLMHLTPDNLLVAAKQLAFAGGLWSPSFRTDGYRDFTTGKTYDVTKARLKIYGPLGPRARPPVPFAERGPWKFPMLSDLMATLTAIPADTDKVIVFPPRPLFGIPRPGESFHACKQRVVELALGFPNSHVFDFQVPSDITRNDSNFWDGQHYSTAIASRVVNSIGAVMGTDAAIVDRPDFTARRSPGP